MKKVILLMGMLLILGSAPATAAELKIGVIDAGSAIAESNVYKKEAARIAGIEKKINNMLRSLEQKIINVRNDFQQNSNKWSADKTLAKQKDMADLEIRFNRDKSDGIQVLKRENEQLNARAVGQLNKAIAEYAKAKGYNLILQKNPAVMFEDGTTDVTGDVVRQMNRK